MICRASEASLHCQHDVLTVVLGRHTTDAVIGSMAVRLSKAFGATPETWLRLQMAYDLAQVRQQKISVKRVACRAMTDDLPS